MEELSKKICSGLAARIEKLKRNELKSLDISTSPYRQLFSDGAQALAAMLPDEYPSLMSLNLTSHDIGAAGMQALAKVLPRFPSLTSLNLGSNKIGVAGVKALAEVLPQCPSLTSLDLSSNEIGDEGLQMLVAVLHLCPSLTNLNLGFNEIGVAGVKALAAVLPQCPSLTNLHFRGNKIGYAGVQVLAPVLPQCPSLISLDLGGSEIGDEGMQVLADVMSRCPSLASLGLMGNEINDVGVKALAAALLHCPWVTSLDLSGNRISHVGVKTLAVSLLVCPLFTNLDLGNNQIGDKGVEALATVLLSCSLLTNLNLSNNKIRTEGAKTLAAVLPNCSSLAGLDLRGNSFFDAGVRALAMVLPQCSSLTSLSLYSRDREIEESSAEVFARMFSECPLLTYSDLCPDYIPGNASLPRYLERLGPLGIWGDIAKSHISENRWLCDTLLNAAESGDLLEVKRALARGASVKSRHHSNGNTPLHVCAQGGHVRVFDYLVSKGASDTTINKKGETPRQLLAASQPAVTDQAVSQIETIPPELAEVIKQLEKNEQTDLDLSGKKIGVAGAKALALVLPRCSSLRSLNLSENDIGVEGVQALAAVLPQCPSLMSLDLSGNDIGAEGTQAVAVVLPECSSLVSLNLSNNYARNAGALALASVLSKCPLLANVDLEFNRINAQGVQALVEVLPSCPLLTSLNLMRNLSSDKNSRDLMEQVNERLKQNPIRRDGLLDAARSGDLALVKDFLTQGASVRSCNDEGNTALHLCALGDHKEVFDYLVSQGASVVAINKERKTPKELFSAPKPTVAEKVVVEQKPKLSMYEAFLDVESVTVISQRIDDAAANEAEKKLFGEPVSFSSEPEEKVAVFVDKMDELAKKLEDQEVKNKEMTKNNKPLTAKINKFAEEVRSISVQEKAEAKFATQPAQVVNATRPPPNHELGLIPIQGIQCQELLSETLAHKIHRATYQGMTVVFKVIKTAGDSAKNKSRIESEFKTLKSIDCPGVIKAYGYSFEGDNYGVVLHFYPQGDLGRYIYRQTEWCNLESWLYLWMGEICTALDFLHGNGVIHKDIKPENIFLDENWHAVLGDFGTAVKLAPNQTHQSTESGRDGTLAFQAPELRDPLSEEETYKYTMACDVFSVGMLLWCCESGKIPYEAFKTNYALYVHLYKLSERKVIDREIIPLRTSPRLAHLIRGCWNEDPKKRPEISEVLAEMKEIYKEKTDLNYPSNNFLTPVARK